MSTRPPKWTRYAACRNAPTELFITIGDEDDDPPYPTPAALQYCNVCPVKPECFQYALDHDEWGVWGGTTEYQRRQLDRARERARCPGCGAADLVFESTIELCLACGMSWRII